MDPLGFFPIAIGVFFLIASCKNWDWFMNTSWPLIELIKRKRLRIYYIIIGLFFIGIGIYLLLDFL